MPVMSGRRKLGRVDEFGMDEFFGIAVEIGRNS